MFTEEQLAQLRSVIREEVEAEGQAIRSGVNANDLKMQAALIRLGDRLKNVEIATNKIDQKLGKSQAEFGVLLHEILNTVSEHHGKLEHRVERIEDHLGLPKPH